MSEYYAVVRSTDHLAHYGIKGMKWGVRRARERGSGRALTRQYLKAVKKLDKLNKKADVQEQKNAARKHNRRAAAALGVGLTGLGAVAGNNLAMRILSRKAAEAGSDVSRMNTNAAQATSNPNPAPVYKPNARKKRVVEGGKGIYKVGDPLGGGPVGENAYDNALNNTYTRAEQEAQRHKVIQNAVVGAGLAGLGTAAYQKGRAIAAKRRTTKEGHAKAVAKRDAFRKEMDKAFAGTRYASHRPKKRR